jgi:hypothetical protein
MPSLAETVTIDSAVAVDVACPTAPDDQVVVINLGADAVWIALAPDDTATVGGDNCQVCLPGLPIPLVWRPAPQTYSMLADTNDTDINIVNRAGR